VKLRTIDRIFGWLLILASCGHTVGTLMLLQFLSGIFVWSLSGSLAVALLGVLNVVRAGRPDDKVLATITAAGTTCWALLALAFGKSIGNMFDPRVVGNVIIAVVLVIFAGLTLRRSSHGQSYRESRTLPSI
jgi:uncharacterized membrane protein YbjE (DUF340 family)